MKNLKRLLSLALTGVMLVGMMAIGASAVEYKDFTDISEIENTEAVSTMVVLGVINGKDTGAFDPNGTVTRAEMAKMITVTLFGGSDPKLGTTSGANFDDTKGNWAESYIEYCASQKIIAGVGARTFNPNGNVTGQQAAKMLLVAIGRNADAFGYVGNDWALNTMGDAITFGLFDNLADIDPSADLTREDAAQMIYNALDVVLWERQPGLNMSTGVVTNGYGPNEDGKTLLSAKFKVITSYGLLTTVNEDELEVTGTINGYDSDDGAETQFSNVAADYSSLLGQAVKVLYKEIKGENVVLGVAPLSINKTITANMNDVELVTSGTNASAKLKVNGKTITLATNDPATGTFTPDGKIVAIVDGVAVAAGSEWTPAANFDNKGTSTQKVVFVDNDNDNRYEYAIVTNVAVEKVIYTSSTSVITTNTYTYEDDTIPTGLVKGDYVAVTKDLFTGEHTLEKIEAIEAKINGTKGAGTAADPKQFLMEGTWYKVGGTLTNNPAVGDTAKAFIINGVIVAGEKVEGENGSINDVAIVLASEKVDGTNTDLFTIHARLMFADGHEDTVVITKASGDAVEAGDFVTYTVKNNTYTLKKMVAANAPEATGYTWVDAGTIKDVDDGTAAAKKVGTIGGLGIADDAVIYLVTENPDDDTGFKNATIITGAELKTMAYGKFKANALGHYYAKSNGLDRVAIAALTVSGDTLPGVGSNDTNYGYIVADAYQSAAKKVTYTIWNGSENEVVTEVLDTNVTTSDLTARKAGTFITFGSVNADGEILNADVDAATTLSLTVGAVQGITASDKITLDGRTETKISKDVAYLYIDSSVSDKLELGKVAGELAPATEMVEGVFVENILYAVEDSEITVIVIDVKNKISKDFGATQLAAASNDVSSNVTALTFKKTDGTALSTSKVLAGDAVTLEYTLAADAGDGAKITLTNAKFADGTDELPLAGVEADTYTVSVYPYADSFKATAADA